MFPVSPRDEALLTVTCQAHLSWNSPGKNTGVGCHSLLQGIFLIQGSNPGFLYCRQILYHLSHIKTNKNHTLEPRFTYVFSDFSHTALIL